jgi:hypothetical protein
MNGPPEEDEIEIDDAAVELMEDGLKKMQDELINLGKQESK